MAKKRPEAKPELTAESLLDYLSRPGYKPLPQRELLHELGVPGEQRDEVRNLLGRLTEEGRVVKLTRGRLAAAREDSRVRGKLTRHRDGYGFVVPDDGGEDVFIPQRDLGDARTGDRVAARVTRRGSGQRLAGVLDEILERDKRRLLGLFIVERGDAVVLPMDPSMGERIVIPLDQRGAAQHEHIVELELLPSRGSDGIAGKVLGTLGHIDEPGTDVRVIAHQFGLPMEIPEPVLRSAARLPAQIGASERRGRERFDDPPPVTIDGETAQDFDDAVAVERLDGNGFRLYVHIADVGHFVKPGDVLDTEARTRGTSVYFPGTVLPMFPEKLSNDLCSLRPGEDRLVQSAILDLDARGKVTSVRFADGVIRSAARLTYTQVAEVLEHGSAEGVPPALVPMLELADRLRALLERRRGERGSIDFDLPVPRILLDIEGAMTGIEIEPRNRANQLIEEFMLAANEAVAGYLEKRNAPCMYRIHETPDPVKLETLSEFARTLGFTLPSDTTLIDAASIRRMLEEAEGRPEYPLLSSVALRSMKQARYSMENAGHFGLAAPTYCHFTSPIRRYPDLVVHRLLRRVRNNDRSVADDRSALEAVAEDCSELERKAEAAERDLLAWKKIEFIRGKEGEEFEGLVTGVTRFGLFVQLTANMVEGLVRVDQLGPDFFAFDEKRQTLRGERIGKTYRLGDRFTVRVNRVDRILRRVDFSVVEPVGDKAGTGASARPSAEAARPRRKPAGPAARRGRGSTGRRRR